MSSVKARKVRAMMKDLWVGVWICDTILSQIEAGKTMKTTKLDWMELSYRMKKAGDKVSELVKELS